MPRPRRCRRIGQKAKFNFFKPSGVMKKDLNEVILLAEEFEAIKLKDLENLEQKICADKMQISQPTFHRILSSARSKISDAIINGKAIRIINE